MAISNSATFTVRGTPPLENTGFEVRVAWFEPIYSTGGSVANRADSPTVIGVIPQYAALAFGTELSASGQGSLTMDLDMAIWAQTMDNGRPYADLYQQFYEYVLQVWQDGVYLGDFLTRNVQYTDVADDGSRQVVISGPGAAELLKTAVIMPPGFPKPPPPGLDPETAVGYKNDKAVLGWEFPLQWSAMRMWWQLYQAARSRGQLRWLHPTFEATKDSGGLDWEYVPTVDTASSYSGFRPDLGQTLYDFLNDCTGQDYSKWFAMRAEWMMRPGFKLEARRAISAAGVPFQGIGHDRSRQIVFFEGQLVGRQRTRVRDDIANYVAVRDANGFFSVSADPTSIARWGKREVLDMDNQNIVDSARRDRLAEIFVDQKKNEQSEWTITVPADLPGRRPFHDFDVGDWIGIGTFNGAEESTVDTYRVLAVTVTDQNDALTCELTLQDRIAYGVHLLEAKLTQTINKVLKQNLSVSNNVTKIIKDPNYSDGSGVTIPTGDVGDGRNANGYKVWIQDTDPGSKAVAGDFWYDTAYTLPTDVTVDPATDNIPLGPLPSTDPRSDPAAWQSVTDSTVPGTSYNFYPGWQGPGYDANDLSDDTGPA